MLNFKVRKIHTGGGFRFYSFGEFGPRPSCIIFHFIVNHFLHLALKQCLDDILWTIRMLAAGVLGYVKLVRKRVSTLYLMVTSKI